MLKAIDILRSELDPKDLPNEWVLERVRNWRNAQLAASDWAVLPDAPTNKDAWIAYRQQLRDLPSATNPQTIELPDAPE